MSCQVSYDITILSFPRNPVFPAQSCLSRTILSFPHNPVVPAQSCLSRAILSFPHNPVVPAEAGIQPWIIPPGMIQNVEANLSYLPLYQSFFRAGFPPPRERQEKKRERQEKKAETTRKKSGNDKKKSGNDKKKSGNDTSGICVLVNSRFITMDRVFIKA